MIFAVMHGQYVTAANSVAVPDESWQEYVLAKVPVLGAFVGVEVDVAFVALLLKLLAQVHRGHGTIRSWLTQIALMAQ